MGEIRQLKEECDYEWTAAYRIEVNSDRCLARITLRVRLVPREGITPEELADLCSLWQGGIEGAWSGRHVLVKSGGACRCKRYTVTVDVLFVDRDEHQVVHVKPKKGRATSDTWYAANTSPQAAAHEAGHWFGNSDEYEDEKCPSRAVTADQSIMQELRTGTVKQRHYQSFADALSDITQCQYMVE